MNGASNYSPFEGAAPDEAILVVDSYRRIATWNRKFIELWGLTPNILAMRDDSLALESVAKQFADPAAFLLEIDTIYAQAELEIHDVVSLKGGRYLKRHTYPLRLGNLVVGRVWQFCY